MSYAPYLALIAFLMLPAFVNQSLLLWRVWHDYQQEKANIGVTPIESVTDLLDLN